MKFYVESVERDGIIFHFFKIGCEAHGRYSHKIWVSEKILEEEIDENGVVRKFVEFPLKGKIKETEKGTKILVPTSGDEKIFYVLCQCGYRGVSTLKKVEGANNILQFKIYDSQLGSLGISSGVIVEMEVEGELIFERSGRRIDEKAVCYKIKGGEIKEFFFANLDEMEDIAIENLS